MPELDQLVEEKLQIQEPHSDFRPRLSSILHPDFPIVMHQAAIKMMTELLKGLKANMKRLYQLVQGHLPMHMWGRSIATENKYSWLLFGLCRPAH